MSPNQIHTAFQMLSLREHASPLLPLATTFLMIPDLLAYFLTGARACERTNAIHSQLYDPRRREWCPEVFSALGLPREIMPPLIDPGTRVGTLCESVQQATGLGAAPVIAPCTHDTGSAVAAVPFLGRARYEPAPYNATQGAAFLSSGTWSVLGALTPAPVTTPEAYAARLNNELSLDFFVCRNIMGLWLLQECRRAWERAGESYGYEELVRLAEAAPAGGPVLFPDAPDFLAPPDMPAAIRAYCERTGQRPPAGVGPMVRCLLESLALSYRHGLDQFTRILGHDFQVVHVVGGGSQNRLLCRLTADATGLPVTAGPVEATVAGNLLVQALAGGFLANVEELREAVRASFEPVEYEPGENAALEGQWERYMGLL
jgi:rhamnulokinase